VCVHLGLWGRHRGVQIEKLRRRIERMVPPSAPLIVAGDFNDWRFRVTHQLAHPLNLHEVFEFAHGRPARSFPVFLPLMSLDRIYVRGLRVDEAHVHRGRTWSRISDHAALTAKLTLL
jgi:endonuclease/exonuclease/phosphatase family metal-dependent hydrolase